MREAVAPIEVLLPEFAVTPFCHGVKIGVCVMRKSPLRGGLVAWARAPLPPQRQRRAAAAAAEAARKEEGRSMSEREREREKEFFVVFVEVEFFCIAVEFFS